MSHPRFKIITRTVNVTAPTFWNDQDVEEVLDEIVAAFDDRMQDLSQDMANIRINLKVEVRE